MREATTRRPALDAAAFDAALRRVVERAVATPADDSAGARVVARLTAPAWHRRLAPRLAAPAVVAIAAAVLLLVVSSRDPRSAPPPSDRSAAAVAAPADVVLTAPADAASPEPRAADPRLITGVSPALAPSARRRSRPRVAAVTAPVEGDPGVHPAVTSPSAVDATAVGWYELTLPPEPLPVDRLEIVAIDDAGYDHHHE